jgi:hypothetical protein
MSFFGFLRPKIRFVKVRGGRNAVCLEFSTAFPLTRGKRPVARGLSEPAASPSFAVRARPDPDPGHLCVLDARDLESAPLCPRRPAPRDVPCPTDTLPEVRRARSRERATPARGRAHRERRARVRFFDRRDATHFDATVVRRIAPCPLC